jgi:23S rRNA-/tRNA-specific pseudouridylate synthase
VATEQEREATAQAYLNAYLGSAGEDRVQVVHRLDRDTSGVLVFAKNFFARERLKEQFMIHSVERIYVAIIEGAIDPPEGTIESNLFEQRDLKMVSVDAHPDAKHAHAADHRTKDHFTKLVTLERGEKRVAPISPRPTRPSPATGYGQPTPSATSASPSTAG